MNQLKFLFFFLLAEHKARSNTETKLNPQSTAPTSKKKKDKKFSKKTNMNKNKHE